MNIQKFLVGFAGNEVKKLARKAVGLKTKGLLEGFFAEKPEKTQARVEKILGYSSTHFKLSKDSTIQFQPSPVFVFEWLMTSPEMEGRLIKDEESGQLFLDDKLLDNTSKITLINCFLEITKIRAASVHSHFEQAFKMLQPADLISARFKTAFAADSDSTATIDGWLVNCFGEGIATDLPYANELFKKWIVGTARRAMTPGSSLDGCFTLVGPAGTGKTHFFRDILPAPFEERTTEVLNDIKDPRKLTESILGKTIVCFDEMAVLDQSKTEDIFKMLLTKQTIDVRLAWRRDPQRYNLRQGFGATKNLNKPKFIPDPTLSRRLWVVELNGKTRLNFDYVMAERGNLWKEAVRLAQTGFSVFLTPSEQAAVEAANMKYVI